MPVGNLVEFNCDVENDFRRFDPVRISNASLANKQRTGIYRGISSRRARNPVCVASGPATAEPHTLGRLRLVIIRFTDMWPLLVPNAQLNDPVSIKLVHDHR